MVYRSPRSPSPSIILSTRICPGATGSLTYPYVSCEPYTGATILECAPRSPMAMVHKGRFDFKVTSNNAARP